MKYTWYASEHKNLLEKYFRIVNTGQTRIEFTIHPVFHPSFTCFSQYFQVLLKKDKVGVRGKYQDKGDILREEQEFFTLGRTYISFQYIS